MKDTRNINVTKTENLGYESDGYNYRCYLSDGSIAEFWSDGKPSLMNKDDIYHHPYSVKWIIENK